MMMPNQKVRSLHLSYLIVLKTLKQKLMEMVSQNKLEGLPEYALHRIIL